MFARYKKGIPSHKELVQVSKMELEALNYKFSELCIMYANLFRNPENKIIYNNLILRFAQKINILWMQLKCFEYGVDFESNWDLADSHKPFYFIDVKKNKCVNLIPKNINTEMFKKHVYSCLHFPIHLQKIGVKSILERNVTHDKNGIVIITKNIAYSSSSLKNLDLYYFFNNYFVPIYTDLKRMHEYDCIHGDIHIENILWDAISEKPYLVDFDDSFDYALLHPDTMQFGMFTTGACLKLSRAKLKDIVDFIEVIDSLLNKFGHTSAMDNRFLDMFFPYAEKLIYEESTNINVLINELNIFYNNAIRFMDEFKNTGVSHFLMG